MPYFKINKINLLFIHIPKTGGSSIEKYFSTKYSIKLNFNSLYSDERRELILGYGCGERFNTLPFDKYDYSLSNSKHNLDITSLQHLTYNTIFLYKELFNINFNNDLKIFTIVRNPYNKIISDLFWFELININSTQIIVYEQLKIFINGDKFDNHNIPQYMFLVDENNNLNKNIIIFKTENLNNNMYNFGFKDFNLFENINKIKCNYLDFLNNDSINLINNIFNLDFYYFNYDKL